MKKLLVFLIVIAMMLTAQTAVFAEVNMVPTYGFDSYAELYFALTDSDSKPFEDLTAVKYYQFSDAYKNTLDAFATKKVRLLVPTIYGEYARLRNAEGLSNITFFADELYSLPWIWYNCKVDGDYDLQIRLNYLSLADIENLDKATSYTDVVPLIAPDAPDGGAPYKATYKKEITLDILGQEKTVMATVSELENSDLFYVFIYYDGILLTLRADGQLFTDEFFASFGMQTAVFEDENNGEDTSLGDINGNYQIDSMDYVLLKRAYFGTYELADEAIGDINGNGNIDSMDYILLKRAYFGVYEIDTPEFITPDDNPILADFTFSLTWNCYGVSSYDSQTGKLIKTTHTYKTNPDDYVTYYQLTNNEKQYIYNLITELDINSYPDIYDPQEGQLMSEPPMTLILSVYCNGTQKTIKAENIACEFTSKDEKGQDFLAVCKAIINTLTATEEWKALPDYEFYYD